MSACAVRIREVLCLWDCHHWHMESLPCVSELREDLPRAIEVGYDDKTLTFILVGFIGEIPAYRQA